MAAVWRGGFANLGMARKLAIGFGLVLALSAGVAAVGLQSMHQLAGRYEAAERMQAVAQEVARLRMQEQRFAASGEEEQAKSLRADLDALRERLGETFADEQARSSMDDSLQSYRQAFDAYVELTLSRQMALEMAAWSAQSVANNLDLLYSGLIDDGVYGLKDSEGREGSEFIDQAGRIAEVGRLMLQGLNVAHQRLLKRGAAAEEEAGEQRIEQAEQARQAARKLHDEIQDPGYRSVLEEVVKQIDAFGKQLDEYATLQGRDRELRDHLQARAEQVVAQVEQANQAERARAASELQVRTGVLLGVAALVVLVGLLAAFLITRLVVGPLQRAIRVARRIAAGDLSERVEVERRDEVGQLLTAIRDMSGSLAEMLGGLQQGVQRIAVSSADLQSTARDSEGSAGRLREEADLVATAMTQMAASVHQVARNAEDAAGAAQDAEKRSGECQRALGEGQQHIEALAAAAGSASQSIERLSEDVGNIGEVLDVIKNVAEQTNLLALNAAIEAARAGEQGRGFAVVADEVRALAKRTQQSTEQIEQLILALRQGAQASVTQIQTSRTLVDQAVADALRNEQALAEIVRAVSLSHQMNQQIAAAAEQQGAVAEEVNRNIEGIRGGAEAAAEATRSTSAASQSLAQVSEELQGLAGRFRV